MIRTQRAMHLLGPILILLAGASWAGMENGEYDKVELDSFIEKQVTFGGNRTIVVPANISTRAKLKSYPEAREIKYLYTALAVMQVEPMPKVNHRMFIESKAGRIIPVYVDDNAVAAIKQGLKLEQQAWFKGYHVYNYSKGPAIVIESFALEP